MTTGTGKAQVPGSQQDGNPNAKVLESYTNGAKHVTDGASALGPIYNDGTYKYFGEAIAGTLTTAASWRVSRMRISDSYIQWVDSGNFTQVYNVEATIIALTYV